MDATSAQIPTLSPTAEGELDAPVENRWHGCPCLFCRVDASQSSHRTASNGRHRGAPASSKRAMHAASLPPVRCLSLGAAPPHGNENKFEGWLICVYAPVPVCGSHLTAERYRVQWGCHGGPQASMYTQYQVFIGRHLFHQPRVFIGRHLFWQC